jgi:hypothetical protein
MATNFKKSYAQYKTLREVVNDLLIEIGEETQHNFLRYFRLGMNGVRELNYDVLREVKSLQLPADSAYKIDLPVDYVNYVRIAVLDSNNFVIPLGMNNDYINIANKHSSTTPFYNGTATDVTDQTYPVTAASGTTPTYLNSEGGLLEESGDLTSFTDPNSFDSQVDYSLHYDNEEYGFYGLGGGNNKKGYYRIDPQGRTIQFSSNIASKTIILEYISDGIINTPGHEVEVPRVASDALSAYIYWKSIEKVRTVTGRGVTAHEKQRARQEYYNQKRLLKSRMMKFNKGEALQQSRKNSQSSPKF